MLQPLGKGYDAKTERERIFGKFITEDADAAKILQMCRPKDNDRDDEEVRQRRKAKGLCWDIREDKELILRVLTVLHSWSVDRYRDMDLSDLSARWAGNIRAFKIKNPITVEAETPPHSTKSPYPPDVEQDTTARLNKVLEDMIACQEGRIKDLKEERDSLREEKKGLQRVIDGLLEEIGCLRAQAASAEE
ncbi:hypothetical protein GP486_003542 [Trichoglossum hirsutum]|uniref:Uncharacterized protein n=1 Tax=Trichoglossum hirsutum TaxID=265104 RepID=A0A9P8RR07_9PEZI|nr:hypothetical protein GP486_003542 [Trichoglossum hirsutum]